MSHSLKDLKVEEQLQKEINAGYSVTEVEVEESIKNVQILDMHKIRVEEYKKERIQKVLAVTDALSTLPFKDLTFAILADKKLEKLLEFSEVIMDAIEEVDYRLENDFCEACGDELWLESEIARGMCNNC
jgi:hypothetical protein